MNIRKHCTLGLALIVLALGATTIQARAQSMLTGRFELPAAAYCGDTLLQPGEYTISMTANSERVPVFELSGEGVRITLLAIARPDKESGRNYLDITAVGGAYVIRAFDSGLVGESFAFGVTKSVRNKALRASAEPSMIVPVVAE